MPIICCGTCDFFYESDLSSDRRQHSRHHDEHVNGIPWKATDRENILEENSCLRLTLVDITSPKFLRNRAAKLGRRANRETRYDFGVYCDETPDAVAILGIVGQRAVSMLVTQSMDWIVPWSWEAQDTPGQQYQAVDASGRRGCSFLWVLPKYRGTGLAKKMADAAIALSPHQKDDFPWAPPFSDLGERFLRRYCPNTFAVGR